MTILAKSILKLLGLAITGGALGSILLTRSANSAMQFDVFNYNLTTLMMVTI